MCFACWCEFVMFGLFAFARECIDIVWNKKRRYPHEPQDSMRIKSKHNMKYVKIGKVFGQYTDKKA